jgi:hypothetical protein
MLVLLIASLLVDPSTYVGNVYGTVSAEGVPVPSATVLLLHKGIPLCSATTDADGKYLINSVPAPDEGRRYSVMVTHARQGDVHLDDVTVLPGAVMALEANVDLARDEVSWRYRHDREYAREPRRAEAGLHTETNNYTRTIFATREGLVGGTTANGHIIVPNDRFVALPSRRALSTRFGNERQVRLTYRGRTVVTPVWDVGPWNTQDDYWNPAIIRQTFKDLPRGKPEAEAAFLEKYNSGLDGRGRLVLNPAGIDLADGIFWIDLALPDNSWIEVEYLWLDSTGPATGTLTATPNPSSVGTVSIEAPVTDESPVEAAEYFIDTVGPSGSGIPAAAADGAFDSTSESIRADFTIGGTPGRTHTIHVHARDAYGNWGAFSSTTVSTVAPSRRRRATTH